MGGSQRPAVRHLQRGLEDHRRIRLPVRGELLASSSVKELSRSDQALCLYVALCTALLYLSFRATATVSTSGSDNSPEKMEVFCQAFKVSDNTRRMQRSLTVTLSVQVRQQVSQSSSFSPVELMFP